MARRQELVAAVAGALAVGLLVLLPLLATAQDGIPALGGGAWWATLVVVLGASGALVVRRRRPVAVALVTAAAVPAAAAVGAAGAIGVTSVAFLVGLFALTTRLPWRWPVLLAAGALVALGQAGAAVDSGTAAGPALAAGALQALVLTGATLLVAAVVVARRDTRAAQEQRIVALEREQDALVQAAVARERTAMARELHDIAAHHLTGIAVLSAAIAAQIDTDPAGAKAAVADVRRQSTAVLRDLRSLVGLLRDPGREETGVRTETLDGLPGLVATAPDAHLSVLGPDDRRGAGIGPLAQLAVYRMVQESLANAARHAAGARVEVTVDDREPDALTVTVTNGPGRPSPDAGGRGGLGLVGMRERAELTGSRLDAGPVEDGWRVRLVVPRSGEEAS